MKKGFISKLKGVLASAAAVVMTVGMIGGNAIPAMADTNYGVGTDTGYTLTIKGEGTEAGHTYKAYQIFAGDLYEERDTSGNVTKRTLSNVVAGYDLKQDEDNTKPNSSLVAALKADSTLNSDFSSLSDTASVAEIADAITKANISNNSEKAIALARVLNNNIITTGDHGKASNEYDTTNHQYTISGLKAGYYLVVDQEATPGTDKNYSRLILEVLSNQEVKPKANIPTLEKKITGVKEGETSVQNPILDEAGKAAVAKVGSTVSFQLTGQVPNITGFTDYTYKITDTLSAGLDFVENNNVPAVNVTIGSTQLSASDFKVAYATTGESGSETANRKQVVITIPISTLKTHQEDADKTITITYDAKVNKDAVSYNFDENTASLEYSNNPESTTTKKTEDQHTYVINIDLDVNKVDKDNNQTKLSGAEFKLYRLNSDGTTEEYYKWDDTNGVTWVDDSTIAADIFTTGNNGNFGTVIRGLDKGTYYLKETKAPDGYNLLTNDIEVTISAARNRENTEQVKYTVTFKNKGDSGESQAATLSNDTITLSNTPASSEQPQGTVTVENGTGSTLPSTGGIGTTIFYVIGGVVVAGAVILLLARRRKNA